MQLIVVVDKFWGIGKNNGLLFRLSKDLQHFKMLTENNVVVMGKNTLYSLPNSKPLRNRINIILSRKLECGDAIIVNNLEQLFNELKKYPTQKVFVIGGASVYHTLLNYCSKAVVTKVNADGNATIFMDNLDSLSNWQLTSSTPWQDDNGFQIQFCEYENNSVEPF